DRCANDVGFGSSWPARWNVQVRRRGYRAMPRTMRRTPTAGSTTILGRSGHTYPTRSNNRSAITAHRRQTRPHPTPPPPPPTSRHSPPLAATPAPPPPPPRPLTLFALPAFGRCGVRGLGVCFAASPVSLVFASLT